MRIAIGSIIHESNTFNPNPTTLADFTVEHGAALLERWRDAHNEVGGFIAGASAYAEILPTLVAIAVPAGPVTRAAFETLTDALVAGFVAALPLDGVLLALHGAMVAVDYADGDGEIARRVRAALGPAIPIVCTYDPHANITALDIANVDVLITYKTNPHVDQRACGLQAAALLKQIIENDIRPTMALRQPPMLLNILHHNTSAAPILPIWQVAHAIEAEPGVLAVSVALGYQYADVAAMGPAVVVVTDDDPDLAAHHADRLTNMLWDLREDLAVDRPNAATAVQQARATTRLPVVLVDMGDNIGGGSAGDSTFLLHELLVQQATGWVVVLTDPAAAAQCAAAGVGATLTLTVGGKIDTLHGAPVAVTGRVTTLHDGRYIETAARHGGYRYNDQGLTAVLEVAGYGSDPASVIILTTAREAPMSLYQLLSVGIQPERQHILVVKAAIAYRAAYEPIAGTIIEVATPGLTSINPATFTYRNIRRPLWGITE